MRIHPLELDHVAIIVITQRPYLWSHSCIQEELVSSFSYCAFRQEKKNISRQTTDIFVISCMLRQFKHLKEKSFHVSLWSHIPVLHTFCLSSERICKLLLKTYKHIYIHTYSFVFLSKTTHTQHTIWILHFIKFYGHTSNPVHIALIVFNGCVVIKNRDGA